MKNILLSLVFLLTPILAIVPASAQVDISSEVCSGELGNEQKPEICDDIDAGSSTNSIYGKDGILTKTINILSLATAIISVFVIVVAGILMSLSQGDPAKIQKSRNQIIYAIVGLIVVIVSQTVVRFILNRL